MNISLELFDVVPKHFYLMHFLLQNCLYNFLQMFFLLAKSCVPIHIAEITSNRACFKTNTQVTYTREYISLINTTPSPKCVTYHYLKLAIKDVATSTLQSRSRNLIYIFL